MQKTNNMIVREAMLYKGLSQVDVARLLAVAPSTVSAMLSTELAKEEQERIAAIIKKYESEA